MNQQYRQNADERVQVLNEPLTAAREVAQLAGTEKRAAPKRAPRRKATYMYMTEFAYRTVISSTARSWERRAQPKHARPSRATNVHSSVGAGS